MPQTVGWSFDNTYSRLPENFAVPVKPTRVRKPEVVLLNAKLTSTLGLDLRDVEQASIAEIFSGNTLPEGAAPIAQAYAGHQYGGFTMLGDGRAILLGEQIAPSGERFDIQLKGSGPTPFSRRGDGRAALGPMLREYLISEAMHALGIATTRSLAVVTTGEPVYRESILPGAILTRIAASHIRVGTFEYFAARQDHDGLKQLADYTINRHFPDLASTKNHYVELLRAVIDRQASLIAQWQHVGFIHGVMNTDNVSICGETIDYGPCAFMDTYHPETVFSSIDSQGRYAYENQPRITHWNMVRFAESLLILLDASREQAVEVANEVLQEFPQRFETYWLTGMRKKLGLVNEEPGDRALVDSLLNWMHRNGADFTSTFRNLSDPGWISDLQQSDSDFAAWHASWQERLKRNTVEIPSAIQLMNSTNPAIIPRNHHVEAALTAASRDGDLSLIERLLGALEQPYEEPPEYADLRSVPSDSGCQYQTFCGT